jgi:hypothetical protein
MEEAYEAQLLFAPHELMYLIEMREEVLPDKEWEDLIRNSLNLFETAVNETAPDEDGLLRKGELVYLSVEGYHHFEFPFWFGGRWESISEEEVAEMVPLIVQILPEELAQIERIIKKAPKISTNSAVIGCSLYLFDQFVRLKKENVKFFIYRPAGETIHPIDFPFW